MLCNKFLEKDERNFHVWNYRLTIFKMIYQYFRTNFWDFLKEELDFTLKMIKKSFSNFSSWHYRSKLINLDLVNKKISWSSEEVLEYLKDDLYFIKNAIFTDPRDQSAWNYYNWILSNINPIFVKSIFIEKHCLKLKLSQKIPFDKLLDLTISNENKNEGSLDLKEFILDDSSKQSQSISEYFGDEIHFDFSKLIHSNGPEILAKLENLQLDEKENFDLKVLLKAKEVDIKSLLFTEKNLNLSNNICPLKNNIDFPFIRFSLSKEGIINLNNSYESSSEGEKYTYLRTFLKNQLEMINELIENTDGFIENAHFKKTQIMSLMHYFKFEENFDLINQELSLLVEKSKRTKEVYRQMIETL
jgi:hypothetical protein